MQPKNSKIKSKIQNLCSKFKMWCAYHRIPAITLPLILLGVLAIAGIVIGGLVLGWDFGGFINSPTGYLIISVAVVAIIFIVGFLISRIRR